MKNKFYDAEPAWKQYRHRSTKLERLDPDPKCPWCACPFNRPWSTTGTSHRNIKRAIRKGELRTVQHPTGYGSRSRTRASCNHECHKGEE